MLQLIDGERRLKCTHAPACVAGAHESSALFCTAPARTKKGSLPRRRHLGGTLLPSVSVGKRFRPLPRFSEGGADRG